MPRPIRWVGRGALGVSPGASGRIYGGAAIQGLQSAPLGHRYSTLGKVMNLKNIQRAICFAVGLVCLIASGWAGDAVAATITNISAVTIPDAIYGTGSTAIKNAVVIGPQSIQINFNSTITTGFNINLAVSNAYFTGSPQISISATGCNVQTLPEWLLISNCTPNSGGVTGITISGISYNSASALATSGTSITLSGLIGNSSNVTTFENITSAAVVTSSAPTSPTLSINSSASTAKTSGSVSLTVTRSGSTTATSTVNYATSNGTASAGTNYTATSGTLTFAANETSKTITVPILNSASQTSDLAFSVILSSLSGGTTVSNATATVTIAASATSSSSVSITSLASTSEGVGTFSIAVTRSGNASGNATVSYASSDGTATAGSDILRKTTLYSGATELSGRFSERVLLVGLHLAFHL